MAQLELKLSSRISEAAHVNVSEETTLLPPNSNIYVSEETTLLPPKSNISTVNISNLDIAASPNANNSLSDQESQFEFSPTMQFPCDSPRLNLN